ncbi:MAG: DUF3726 domain-containing protein [Pseudomonadota bacterium]
MSLLSEPGGREGARYSLSEIDAQCRKAARGAGCAFGLAEEAGKAARWLSQYGLPGAEAVSALLSAERQCACGGGAGPACALRFGASCADRVRMFADGEQVTAEVAQPLVVVGILGRAAAAARRRVALEWSGVRALCGPEGLAVDGAGGLLSENACVRIAVGTPAFLGRPASPAGRWVEAEAWERLEAYAARTYAPATEASRRLGAGAAESD